jgi:uncharacterized protein
MDPALWSIEVVYARSPTDIFQCQLTVPVGTSIRSVIEQSGILTMAPDIDLAQQVVGIFGQVVSLDDRAYEGARIEIYRRLHVDPKTARRLRVK